MRLKWMALPALAALLILSGCDWDEFDHSSRYTADFHHSYPLKAGGRLAVENFNGSVEISGWDESTVDISGTKYGPTPELRDAIKIDISAAPDSVSIRTVRPIEKRGNLGAKYVIKVPRKVKLERIVSSNGSIRTTDVDGDARLRTSNGAIRAMNLRGSLEAQTTNGTVELDGIEGSASVRTSNGRVRAEKLNGSLEAYTTNGGITAEIAKSERGRPVKVGTTNGSVDLRVGSPLAEEVRASTTNGSITVKLPSDIKARVLAHTSNSSISTDFEVQTQGALSKNHLEGTIGSGGPLLDLTTSNGSIRLVKI